jgi:hypothetical protein
MKNITLSVEDDSLEAVRLYAARNKTTVNAIVRDTFDRIAKSEDRVERARRRIQELADRSKAEMGPITWKREDLYDR